jgi:DNA primase
MTAYATDLVQLVAAYIPLAKSRRTLRGNGPFHPDTAGSFMVFPEKQIFKCFGCGQEGGVTQFKSAIEKLARS